MNEKDAAIKKTLAELGLIKEPELSPEEEHTLQQALDLDAKFYADVERIFSKTLDKL